MSKQIKELPCYSSQMAVKLYMTDLLHRSIFSIPNLLNMMNIHA